MMQNGSLLIHPGSDDGDSVGMGWRLVLNGFIVVAVIVAAGGEKWER
jgi:hypothetical protein